MLIRISAIKIKMLLSNIRNPTKLTNITISNVYKVALSFLFITIVFLILITQRYVAFSRLPNLFIFIISVDQTGFEPVIPRYF